MSAPAATDPNSRDISGRTPLHHACLRGDSTLVKKLLDQNADENSTGASVDYTAQDGQGQTALHLALKLANDHAKTSGSTSSAAAASSTASSSSSDSNFRLCAGLILDADERAQRHAALSSKRAKMSATASPSSAVAAVTDEQTESGSAAPTPPSLLLSIPDAFGRIALHWSICDTSLLLRCLHPSLVNAQTQSGETAAHYAAQDDNIEALEILLQSGARIDIKNGRGETIEDCAKSEVTRSIITAWQAKHNASTSSSTGDASNNDASLSVSASSLASRTSRVVTTSAAPKKKTVIKLNKK